ncbi:MAG: thioether cross-link-forming SCIFF peptide maturase [Anaerovoracaceae bacterium]
MIHQYKLNGYNIVIDNNSGAIHSVDDLAYDIIGLYGDDKLSEKILEKYKDINQKDIDETIADIEELKKQGKLFSEDIFREFAPKMKKQQSVVKAICLHVAHDCNMDCGYCFAGKGEYKGEKGMMPYEVGVKALDFLVENSGSRHNLEVDFFGGEPLLNWNVVKKLVRYGRTLEAKHNKNFRFTLTTNGLMLNDEIIEFCNEEMSNVVISLDGKPDVHNNMRKTRDGGDTYDRIIESFKDLAVSRKQKDYYMRGTYTSYNKEFASDIIHMADEGFKELSMEPVVAPKEAPYALSEKDLPILKKQYEILAKEMLKRKAEGNEFNFYHFSVDLTGGPCISKRISGCGVGTEYLAITPKGDIYPCHQFVGEDEFCLGNIFSGIDNLDCLDRFSGCNVYSHKECQDCFAKLYCSGGCAANAYFSTGSVNGVYNLGCELHKKRIECAIMMKVSTL